MGGQADDDRGGVGEGHMLGDRGPATEGWALQAETAEETKDAAEEVLDTAALAQFVGGPGGRQTGAVLLALEVPGHDRHRAQSSVDPRDEA